MPSIVVDLSSAVPPYEQIRAQVAALVASGDLRLGDRLPPVRTLAGEMGVAPGTVARAYRELERSGVVETRGRAGTIVARGPLPAAADAGGTDDTVGALRGLEAALGFLVRAARPLGLSPDELADLVRMRMRDTFPD